MVFTNKYAETLLKEFQEFAKSKSLHEAIELYKDGDPINIYTVFTGLTNYVINELGMRYQNISDEELTIYLFVEKIRNEYSDFPEKSDEFDFDNAACTCFLENLLNRASWGDINYSRFIPYLGKKSKEYCRAWDKFTGVKTPGLY